MMNEGKNGALWPYKGQNLTPDALAGQAMNGGSIWKVPCECPVFVRGQQSGTGLWYNFRSVQAYMVI